jgi:predicted ATP-grasp superfamily ATP-dependent carboligase
MPIEEIGSISEFPVLLKGRHSWVNGIAHPRGVRCDSQAEVEAALGRFAEQGFGTHGFCLQAWMPNGVTNCWSVAGWYDYTNPSDAVLLVTRKLAATRSGLGYALLVGTADDPGGLRERAGHLLGRIEYHGPFELEFLFDRATGRYYELEFNPRYWLQHSILVNAGGNSLILRYLGMDVEGSGLPERPVLWVSGIGLLMCLLRPLRPESLAVWRHWREWGARGAVRIVDPPLLVASRLLLKDAMRRIRRLLLGDH